ncbi:MAG: hypothetical protein PARBA_03455 [Parabacteroides sp.]|jgi:hypothetical protein
MAIQTQTNLQLRKKGLDDVFHRTIIALERLELFLMMTANDNKQVTINQTAIRTSRDLHDDEKNPPSKDSFFGEVQLQTSALFFQTEFDDKEVFSKAVQYFLNDLLEWYGGRSLDIPYDEVEKFFIPIMVSLNRQATSVIDIMQAVSNYVGEIKSIESLSHEEKEKAVMEGFKAFMLADHKTQEENQAFEKSGEEIVFTSHKRGEAIDGYKRLYLAFIETYDEPNPAKLLVTAVTNYLPEIAKMCPDITLEIIETKFSEK